MNLAKIILVALLFAGAPMGRSSGQASATEPVQYYTLVTGSLFMDDCIICDRISPLIPMTGTFGLRLLEQNPLLSRYEVLDISFRATNAFGLDYKIVGGGTYQVGGEVAVAQDLYLDVQVYNGITNIQASCANSMRDVTKPLPAFQVNVDQTNGTLTQTFRLTIVAAPRPQFHSIFRDLKSGNIRLDWNSNGQPMLLERAKAADGPYEPVTPLSMDTTFTDVGALTTRTQSFYRLRQ